MNPTAAFRVALPLVGPPDRPKVGPTLRGLRVVALALLPVVLGTGFYFREALANWPTPPPAHADAHFYVYVLARMPEVGGQWWRLADDPLHKLVLDREPLTGRALSSQPTLSRFETGVRRRDLVRVGQGVARTVIAHHRRRLHGRVRRITLDLDPTDDPTHGQQELSFFNGHYDTACYLPLVATLTFDDEALQYLAGIVLRPGNAVAIHADTKYKFDVGPEGLSFVNFRGATPSYTPADGSTPLDSTKFWREKLGSPPYLEPQAR